MMMMAIQSQEMDSAGNFFIADKLRGIPLVSGGSGGGRNRNQTAKEASSAIQQLEKREVPANEASAILFRAAGITASTSNLRRQTSTTRMPTTTTRRPPAPPPPKARTANTIRTVAAAAAAAPTRKPQQARSATNARQPAQVAGGSSARSSQTRSNETTTNRAQTEPAKIQAPEVMADISERLIGAKKSEKLVQNNSNSSSSTEPIANYPTTNGPANDGISSTSSTTRTAQLLTTQPGYQRRTQQPVLSSRFSSSSSGGGGGAHGRGASAGENWFLFNRPDGGYSFFEILVLLASLIMVSTIVIVILGNLFKSFKKKRALSRARNSIILEEEGKRRIQAAMQQQQPAAAAAAHDNVAPMESRSPSMNLQQQQQQHQGDGDGFSKISMISSGLTSNAPTTATAATLATASDGSELLAAGLKTAAAAAAAASNSVGQSAGEASKLAMGQVDSKLVGPGQELVQQTIGAAQNISSEIKQAAGNISNKAMAIVQPTENNAAAAAAGIESGADNPPEKSAASQLGEKSLSASDHLITKSGPPGNERPAKVTKGDDVPADKARVKTLQELFESSGGGGGDSSNSGKTAAKQDPGSSVRPKQQQQEMKKSPSRVGSLDSIELPPTLVESIKQAEIRAGQAAAKDEAPSPNLLLGEKEVASSHNISVAVDPAPAAAKTKIATSNGQTETNKAIGSNGNSNALRQGLSEASSGAKSKQVEQNKQAAPPKSTNNNKPAESTRAANNGDADKSALKSGLQSETATNERPGNPMGRDEINGEATANGRQPAQKQPKQQQQQQSKQKPAQPTAEVKNHQVVVNKLDKRKTNLEIVDLRDDSVTGKMRQSAKGGADPLALDLDSAAPSNWISMDGVAVVQPPPPSGQQQQQPQSMAIGTGADQAAIQQQQVGLMSPSEIIESRFHVDYKAQSNRRRGKLTSAGDPNGDNGDSNNNNNTNNESKDSNDSKATDHLSNTNIEHELEQDNKMRNRKYFVYIVHDGHFTAKKECIARIELPPTKRKITLAEMRQLIANSQDISLTSLRRNRFKFVTETYRLLNENEDATVLHQVYPTQGVFLKLNIPDQQESQSYKSSNRMGGGRLSSTTSSTAPNQASSSHGNTTIASRRRNANGAARQSGSRADMDAAGLPAIEVDYSAAAAAGGGGRARASSVQRRGAGNSSNPGGAYRRSKSSLVQGRANNGAGSRRQQQQEQMTASHERLPSIGRSKLRPLGGAPRKQTPSAARQAAAAAADRQRAAGHLSTAIGGAATDLGQNVLSGAKRLFNAFNI